MTWRDGPALRTAGKILLSAAFAFALHAQAPATPAPAAPAAAISDPLGRSSPQSSIFQFLEACRSRDYSRADRYLDLRSLSTAEHASQGPALARQLEDLLNASGFDIATLSRDPEGDRTDNLPPQRERLAAFRIAGRTATMEMERVQLKNGLRVWVVAADSVHLIPAAHTMLSENWFEKDLPQQLVTTEILDTPIWRWIALAIAMTVLWLLVSAMSRTLASLLHSRPFAPLLRQPLRLLLLSAGFRLALEYASPSPIPRLFLDRAAGLVFSLALAWGAGVLVDILAERWSLRLDASALAISYSILPLGRQILKVSLYLIVLLSVLNAWGVGISTVLAGIGVGGIAVALAAQKTIENLFGGISVIGDRPVLVGDACRFGNNKGTVIHIGLRSTRLRTPDRTVISVPNAQFATMELENYTARDKMWFHPMLNLRKDTTSAQLTQVLAGCQDVLTSHPKIEPGKTPVRLVGLGVCSLDIEVNVYVTTIDNDEFLAVQQDLLLQLVQAVENAGAAFASPWQPPGAKPED